MPTHTPPRLFLVDGYALIYRAFFAMISRPLRTSKGENTSAAWGVVNFLLRRRFAAAVNIREREAVAIGLQRSNSVRKPVVFQQAGGGVGNRLHPWAQVPLVGIEFKIQPARRSTFAAGQFTRSPQIRRQPLVFESAQRPLKRFQNHRVVASNDGARACPRPGSGETIRRRAPRSVARFHGEGD